MFRSFISGEYEYLVIMQMRFPSGVSFLVEGHFGRCFVKKIGNSKLGKGNWNAKPKCNKAKWSWTLELNVNWLWALCDNAIDSQGSRVSRGVRDGDILVRYTIPRLYGCSMGARDANHFARYNTPYLGPRIALDTPCQGATDANHVAWYIAWYLGMCVSL